MAKRIVHKVRGRPFEPGNPGRPPGSKNKVTEIVEQLAEGSAERLIQKAVELAEDGNVAALRMLLDRLWPPRKGQPVNLNMPQINSPQDVLSVVAAIWTAVGEGRITPEEASALSGLVDRSIRAVEQQEIIQRLERLEKDRESTK